MQSAPVTVIYTGMILDKNVSLVFIGFFLGVFWVVVFFFFLLSSTVHFFSKTALHKQYRKSEMPVPQPFSQLDVLWWQDTVPQFLTIILD